MIGLGTIINAFGILIGSVLGCLFGKVLNKRFQDILNCSCGVCVLFLGITGTVQKSIILTSDGTFAVRGSLMAIASMCIGALVGEMLNIEKHTEDFGEWLKVKSKSEGDTCFVDGFVTSSLTVCVGAMAVIGPINDAIYGDLSTLIAKSVLDTVIIFTLSSTYGKGCAFSALPIIVVEGLMTLLAKLVQPILTTAALDNLSLVGSMLIFCVGVNLTFGKRIRVANLLPAMLVAILAG